MLQMPFPTIYTRVQIASALFVEFWFDLSPVFYRQAWTEFQVIAQII